MPTTVINQIGKQGDAGRDGTDGVNISQVREAKISSPTLNLFKANDIDPDVSWTRDDQAAFADRYGVNQYVTGDSITHVLANTNNFSNDSGVLTHEWQYEASVAVRNTDRTEPDPDGGTLASQFTLSGAVGIGLGIMGNMLAGTGDIIRVSIYVKVVSGTLNKVSFRNGSTGSIIDFEQAPDSTWQRLTVITASTSSSEARFLFDCPGGCVVHIYRANITKGAKLQPALTIGDTRPTVFANPDPVYRQNEFGYLIEGQKTNLCPNSQDIAQWSATGSPTVGQNPLPDAYGDANTNTLITFQSSQAITVSEAVTATAGATYAVSFFAVTNSGSVESLSVSLGGGVSTSVELTDGYVRQEINLVAGSNNTITFTATSSLGGTSFILHSVQVEVDQHSSYIPTGTDIQTREADIVSVSGAKLPNIANGFTLQVAWRNVDYVADEDVFLFNTDTGTAVIFQAPSGTPRILFRSNVISAGIDVQDAAGELIITFDGTTTRFYKNGVLLASTTGLLYTGAEPNILYLGAQDAVQAAPLNAYIKTLRWWDFEMTADEVKYISEYDTTNRYEDRG